MHRNARCPEQTEHPHRVVGRLGHVDIAGRRRDQREFDLRRADRQCDRHRVIDPSIDIEDEVLSRHQWWLTRAPAARFASASTQDATGGVSVIWLSVTMSTK